MLFHMVIDQILVIEPYLTDQWFVDAKKLAGPAIEAVKMEKQSLFQKHGKILF